jgi:hypothetical protein
MWRAVLWNRAVRKDTKRKYTKRTKVEAKLPATFWMGEKEAADYAARQREREVKVNGKPVAVPPTEKSGSSPTGEKPKKRRAKLAQVLSAGSHKPPAPTVAPLRTTATAAGTERACDVLLGKLVRGKAIPEAEIEAAIRAAGVREPDLLEACDELGVVTRNGVWRLR